MCFSEPKLNNVLFEMLPQYFQCVFFQYLCVPYYYIITFVCPTGVIDDPCDVRSDCTAAIYRSDCTNNTCVCIPEYDPIPGKTKCVPSKKQ